MFDEPEIRRGPKRKPRAEIRSKFVQVTLTPWEKQQLDDMASVQGVTASSIIRNLFTQLLRERGIELPQSEF